MNNNNNDSGKKPLYYYYVLALVVLMVLNTSVFPAMFKTKVTDLSYDAFIQMVDEGKFAKVEISDKRIAATAKDPEDKKIYVTGRVDDNRLVEKLMKSKVTFSQVIPKESGPLESLIYNWILPIIFFIVIGQLIMRYMGGKGFGGMGNFGKSVELVDFLHNPGKYSKIGATMPKGALLVGPPGTGKTLLAKAIAGEARVPFFSISGSEFIEMFVGMGAARVRDLFKEAQKKAPCIVFIDEIDAIGKKRDSGAFGSNDEREQTLNQLLSEMDGFDGSKGVIILAATNRPESLDAALLRPGRFDRRIPVELPDLNGREAILKVHAKDVQMQDDVDLKKIARSTPGASGAELANIINEAALCAVRNKRDKVTNVDLEQAVDIIIAGYQRKSMVISEEEKKNTAYHEIGHALVAASQTHSAPVEKITIIPHTNGSLGYTMQVDEQEKVNYTKEELFTKIVTFTGGRAAEEVVFNHMTAGASNDIEQATRMARAMVTRFGMTEEFGMMGMETVHNAYLGGDATLTCSETTLAKVDVKVMEIIKEAHQKALEILREHREDLDRLAKYLLEKETITGVEFMAILNNEDPVEAVRRAAEDAETRNAEQRVKDEEKARREAEELAAKQAQWTAASAAAGMESGALGTEAKDGAADVTAADKPPVQEKTVAEVDAELREAIRKAEADPEEAEREARTVQENSRLTDAEFRPADEEKRDI